MTDGTGPAAAAPPPDRWAIVEVMGHLTRAGRVSAVQDYGTTLMRIEVPAGEGFVTEDIGGASLYRIRYVTEEVARAAAARLPDPRPILPAAYRERPALDHRPDDHGGYDEPF